MHLPELGQHAALRRGGVRGQVPTPELFAAHVRRGAVLIADKPADERVLVIKSWNEWAEGNHLEPDTE